MSVAPTIENITEIANARSARKGLDPEIVIERAWHYASRPMHPAPTAPAAVEWAFHDLTIPTEDDA